ncbi:hypothetical protein DS745_09235 [Anaerobacillus alkaliphilus]|uniref:Tetratricopeptide repeat protein n=1 Tax=Anaerobacillus alkaliphilus TaxID=1548597 RepID=A0A4V1LGH2_9BACI|nr:FxLYD domain-containing protein [Anaerobacillus alkaliphilus]RXJ01654.1 hypothetical protein DS745_09235 [Anaerobacillus alkaliphilus]
MSKRFWLVPTMTLFTAIVVLGSFFFYESTVNSEVEQLVREGEALALEGELEQAKATFEEVLVKRPNHTAAAFNLEVVERGLEYMALLNGEDLDKLEYELAQEEGPFFEMIKEQYRLVVATLSIQSEAQTMEDLVELYEKTWESSNEETIQLVEVIKEKIVDLAIVQGLGFLEKNQFTEAEVEFNLGLTYDPKNSELLNYLEKVKTARIDFEEEEQNRIERAMSRAAEEDNFNWTEAGKPLGIYFSYDEEKLVVSGEVKNVGTRPISEIDIHYKVLGEDGRELTMSFTNVTPFVLMPNERGRFEETLVISEMVGAVEIVDCFWTVE